MAYSKFSDVKPQEGKQTDVFKIIQENEIDFMLMGGSRGGGKSELLTMVPLLWFRDKGFRGLFLRREYNEIMGGNGIWEKACNMYPLFNGKANVTDKLWKFKSGANIRMRHMQHEQDKESFRGQGYSFIGIDEIDQFSKESVTFLMTCLRSEANMNSFLVGTLNPSKSWCLPLVEYYLDEKGSPDPEKFGHIRHFVVKGGEFIFGPDEQWFIDNHPETVYIQLSPTSPVMYVRPKRFMFCFFSVLDNPALMSANPVYISELNNLPEHERQTQLFGNWYAEATTNTYFDRKWLRGDSGDRVKTYGDIPQDMVWYRGVDKGYSIPSDTHKYPDYTAISPKVGRDKDGFWWIVGDYSSECCEDGDLKLPIEDRHLGQYRKLAGERDQILIKQAQHDGDDIKIVLTKDSGAGTTDHNFTKTKLIEEGISVVEDKSPRNTTDKKIKDFQPFCNACQVGMVYIVEESFNKRTLDYLYNQFEIFDGLRSTSAKKDDQVDAMALAFSASNTKTQVKEFSLGANTVASTRYKTVMGSAAPSFTKF